MAICCMYSKGCVGYSGSSVHYREEAMQLNIQHIDKAFEPYACLWHASVPAIGEHMVVGHKVYKVHGVLWFSDVRVDITLGVEWHSSMPGSR